MIHILKIAQETTRIVYFDPYDTIISGNHVNEMKDNYCIKNQAGLICVIIVTLNYALQIKFSYYKQIFDQSNN